MQKNEDREDIGINPFLVPLKIKAVNVQMIGKPDGEVLNTFLIEKEESAKLFRCANAHQFMAGLSDRAQRLLFYILYTVRPNEDYFKMNRKYYMRINGIKSDNTVIAAIKELLHNAVIIKSVQKDYFFINPALFFVGNRIKQLPDNVQVVGTMRLHK